MTDLHQFAPQVDGWHPDYRHARDITDEAFLAAVKVAAKLRRPDLDIPANRWDIAAVLGGMGDLIANDGFVDDVPGVPAKVVLAKARRLMKRRLLTGCDCGCRGDFEVVEEKQ